jgi:GLPGLI family protein
MKKLLSLFILLAPFAASAQQGTITYNEVMKIEIELPPEMESMRDQIPDARTSVKQLLFTDSASLYRNAPGREDEGDITMGSESEGVMIRMAGPSNDNATFVNLDNEIVVDKQEFMGRTFLITGEREPIAWRMTSEQSEFLGHLCQKAVATRDSSTVEAWFTPEIPVSIGPANFGGLPGAILVLSIDDGRLTFTATSVDQEELEPDALEAPRGGREVTREEFDRIVEEKMKEMGVQRGGRGGTSVRMIIEN